MNGPRRTVVFVVAAICACAGGPALAAVVSQAPAARAGSVRAPHIITLPPATTSTTGTTTTATGTATDTTTTSTTTTTPPPSYQVCLPSTRRLIARRLGVAVASISYRQVLASNGMPQCNFVIPRARRGGPAGKVVLTVNADNGPQAHWRLMRKVVEASQIFGPTPPGFRPPRQVKGLGPYASWFPALNQLMAINLRGRYLLTVGVIWHHTTAPERIAITRAVITIYRPIAQLPS